MSSIDRATNSASPGWRYATYGLVTLLVASWACFGLLAPRYAVGGSKYLVVEADLRRDLVVLTEASRECLTKQGLLEIQGKLEPRPARVVGNNVLLRAVAVKFDDDGQFCVLTDR